MIDLKTFAFKFCLQNGITVLDLKGENRKRELVDLRHIFCYVIKLNTNITLKSIGDFLNGRNHATIIHAIQKIESLKSDHIIISNTIDEANKILNNE